MPVAPAGVGSSRENPASVATEKPVRREQSAPPAPKVSVLIPTFNYARYLPEAIESVLEQDFEDYELLVVDDCSEDESQSVIRRYAALDSRIHCRFNPSNLGMVANWNYCLSQARGEYVQFLFGDDRLAGRNTLRKMARLLDDHPSAVMAVAARNIIDGDSKILEVADHLGAGGLRQGRELISHCLENGRNLIGEPSVVMMRKCEAARGFNGSYRQIPDLEMWFHLLERGDAVYTPEPLYSFRRHPRQQTEINRLNRVGPREQLALLNEYQARPWLNLRRRPKLLFSQIYWLRKEASNDVRGHEIEAEMMARLGRGRYARMWVCYKLRRPFSNLRRFWFKHILRRPIP